DFLRSEGYDLWLGSHFFTQIDANASLPTFSLDHTQESPFPVAIVSKKEAADAPGSACCSPMRENNVQWLRLVDDNDMSVGNIDTVYRVETAGGSRPATCKGQEKTFEVPYTAQYWMYSNKA
ncbi:hypothetical protein DM02DRAFT_662525, partial [Periconia macrospinosa]